MNLILMLAMAANAAAAPAPAKDAPGKELYAKKCAACHAKDGKGSAAMAKMFKADQKVMDLTSADVAKDKDEDLIKVINDGRNKMPSFKGKLKEAEIKDVVAYIRTLAPKAGAK